MSEQINEYIKEISNYLPYPQSKKEAAPFDLPPIRKPLGLFSARRPMM